METTLKPFLKSPITMQHGKVLLESQLQVEGCYERVQAKVYEGIVVIGRQYFECTFDIQFQTSQDYIQFYHQGQIYNYNLPLKDGAQWINILRQQINRVGFHQNFKAVKKIGKGNFASVYLVESVVNAEKFAVKAFSKQVAYSEENGKECLMKEIQIMRKLKHRNNMHLYEVYESNNSLYIVFELLEGGQLYQKIKVGKLSSAETCQMVHSILLGLKQMHSKNIMHRDLKPQNILLRDKGECVIADYGLAQFCDSDEYLFVRCGTPGYVAPQVINIRDMNTRYTFACDMFSLGLIFHLLIFGKSIFQGKTYNQVLTQNRNCDFNLNTEQYKKLPIHTLDLLQRLLKIKPEERISANQALKHPYFSTVHQQLQTLDVNTSSMPMMKIKLKKDSCLQFKMGKENIFTGGTETIGTLGSSHLSNQSVKGTKFSKFSKFDKK